MGTPSDIREYQNIMSKNLEIYVSAFIEAFEVDEGEVVTLKYESIPAWDSVGHMVLMAALEEGFDIMLDMEDIIDFSDFEKGKELLKKYDESDSDDIAIPQTTSLLDIANSFEQQRVQVNQTPRSVASVSSQDFE